jgi:hypothetical protein
MKLSAECQEIIKTGEHQFKRIAGGSEADAFANEDEEEDDEEDESDAVEGDEEEEWRIWRSDDEEDDEEEEGQQELEELKCQPRASHRVRAKPYRPGMVDLSQPSASRAD